MKTVFLVSSSDGQTEVASSIKAAYRLMYDIVGPEYAPIKQNVKQAIINHNFYLYDEGPILVGIYAKTLHTHNLTKKEDNKK